MYDAEINVQITNQPLWDKIIYLQSEVTRLQALVDSQTATIAELTSQVETLSAQVTSLSAQVDSLTIENTALTAQVASLTQSVETLTQGLTTMTAKVNQANGEEVQNPADYLLDTKSQILTALQNKGSSATTSTTFREYANIISHFNVLPDGDEHTTLLLHLDGEHQLTDSSIYRRPIATYGTPVIEPHGGKFGTGYVSLDGTSCFYVNQTNYYPFESGYTIEFFLEAHNDWAYSGWYTLYSQVGQVGTQEIYPWIWCQTAYSYSSTRFRVGWWSFTGSSTTYADSNSTVFPTTSYWHYAVVKDPEDSQWFFRVYVNGNFIGWYGNNPTSVLMNGRYCLPLAQINAPLYFFGRYSMTSQTYVDFAPCNVCELRVSNVPRYKENFTPPTEPFMV